ncbi:autophagy-related protein 101-like [Typha angustifolia]|uniref:autophagy-related protein 101-like n=1 Tax=Typha angustifolia TaxID=59011 RepID=UPI003C2C6450
MSCELFELKELALVSLEIRDVLRCILHTILFHRALGLVRPKDVDCRRFDITYVQCGDAEVEKKIDEKIDQFISWVEKHPNRKSQVTLSFYEVRNKHPTWFSNKTERLYWEQWHINLHITNPKTHGKSHNNTKASEDNGENAEETSFRHAALESSLREVLFQVINLANNKGDHIPSVTNSDVVSFPYEITLPR